MVVMHCCYGLCKSDNRYPDSMPARTTFLPFPKPGKIKEGMDDWLINQEKKKIEKAKRWVHACGRKDFSSIEQITKSTYICSLHFLKNNPDPIIATSVTEEIRKVRQPRKRPPPPPSPSPLPPPPSPPAMHGEVEEVEETFVDQSTQTDNEKVIFAAKLENKILRNSFILANDSSSEQRKTNSMSFQTIYHDCDTCKYFIGLFPEQFNALFEFLGPAKESLTYWDARSNTEPVMRSRTSVKTFSVREQLFITLLRLRRGFHLQTLAHFYDVCEGTIRRIFTIWIMSLFYHFKDYETLMFPPRNAFRENLPAVFRPFKNIRCIVDCTEIFCEVSRDYSRVLNTRGGGGGGGSLINF